jgi:hypothetical protein
LRSRERRAAARSGIPRHRGRQTAPRRHQLQGAGTPPMELPASGPGPGVPPPGPRLKNRKRVSGARRRAPRPQGHAPRGAPPAAGPEPSPLPAERGGARVASPNAAWPRPTHPALAGQPQPPLRLAAT